MTTTSTGYELVLEHRFAASRERVFRAWTHPEVLRAWWAAAMHWDTAFAEIDLRTGGAYRLGMRNADSNEVYVVGGTFTSIEPPSRLVYSWTWETAPPVPGSDNSTVVVDFIDEGETTLVRLVHSGFENAEVRDQHTHGWSACLDNLERRVFPAADAATLPALLRATLDALEAQRDTLIAIIDGAQATGAADGWSANEVVDHLLLAEGFTNEITIAMAAKARAEQAAPFPADLDAFAPLPPPTGTESPETITPRRSLQNPVEDLLAMRERTRASFTALAAFDPRAYSVPHPLFGPLDLGQWWVLQSVHYGMHADQARAALQDSARGT